MYIAGRVRDSTAVHNNGARSNACDKHRSEAGAIRFNVYNSFIGADADSRRDRAHRHRHTHR
jgi:hypothetical protein